MQAVLQEIFALYRDRGGWFLELLVQHITLVGTAILIAGTLGLLIGIFIAEHDGIAPFAIGICNVIYTIPSISLFGMLIPFLGIGEKTAVTALCIYGIMPMVRNTYTGIQSIDPSVIEAARGMGGTDRQILWQIKLPLAIRVILAGIRNMMVMLIAMGGIAAYIGAGGLGVAVFRGISVYNLALTFAGSIMIAGLALLADFLLSGIERWVTRPWRTSAKTDKKNRLKKRGFR